MWTNSKKLSNWSRAYGQTKEAVKQRRSRRAEGQRCRRGSETEEQRSRRAELQRSRRAEKQISDQCSHM
jgi:hypothetical protein